MKSKSVNTASEDCKMKLKRISKCFVTINFFGLVCAGSFPRSAFAVATASYPDSYSLSAQLYYSDVNQPNITLKSISFSNIIQVNPNKISSGNIDLEIVDTSLGSIDLSHIAAGETPSLMETYALQVLYAGVRAADFYQKLGVKIGVLHLKIQDPSVPPFASRMSDTLSFNKLNSLEKQADSHLNIRDFIPMISDVVFHEMTHFVQGKKTMLLESGLLGTTSYEGHANLMAYMICGRTDLGVLPGDDDPMRAFSRDKFGFQIANGHDHVPLAYKDYEPFSSVLVQIHDLILSRGRNDAERLEMHMKIAKVFLNIVMEADGSETFQMLSNRTLKELSVSNLTSQDDSVQIKKMYVDRGLSIDDPKNEGYIGGLLINHNPPDRGDGWLRSETIRNKILNPVIDVQDQFWTVHSEISGPITGILVSEASLQVATKIMQDKYVELIKTSPNPTSTQLQSLYVDSIKIAGLQGVDIGGITVKNAVLQITKDIKSIQFTSDKSGQCNSNAVLLSPLVLFDSNGNQFGQLTLPFICPI